MTKLIDLLTEIEIEKINQVKWISNYVDPETEIRKLTVEQLSYVSFIVMETEYGKIVPQVVLSAEAINILNKRAIEKNLPIFG